MVCSTELGGAGATPLPPWLEPWRCLAEAVPDILLLVDREGTVQYINRAGSGFSRAEVHGARVFDFVPAEFQAGLRDSLGEIFAGAGPQVREVPVTHPDGSIRWFATHTGPVFHGGKVVAATIVARDVTEQKQTEAALRESEGRYRTLVEHAPEAIVVFDVDACRFVDANRNASALFGLSHEALLRSNPVELSPPTQADGQPSAVAARERIDEALAGGVPAFEWTHRTPGGADLRCEVRLVRLPADGRRLVRGSITDVTRQRQVEEHLRQWQKLEALGQLAGGIAHDFNNLLMVISGSAELLAEQLPAASPLRREAEGIRGAVLQGSGLTRQLLGFARRREPERGRLDLNVVVEDALVLLARLLGPGITLVQRLDPAGAPIVADRTQVEQVLMNLVLNARDAMREGGTITVGTLRVRDRIWPEGERCRVDGPTVHLRVADTGTGMDEATCRQIFTPFFTTKSAHGGTGLGLSIVQAIVKRSRGCLEVASRPGAGTTFEVILPDADHRPTRA